MFSKPGPCEVRLIKKEIDQVGTAWRAFQAQAINQWGKEDEALQALKRTISQLMRIIDLCQDGRGPYIEKERNLARRREREFNRRERP